MEPKFRVRNFSIGLNASWKIISTNIFYGDKLKKKGYLSVFSMQKTDQVKIPIYRNLSDEYL